MGWNFIGGITEGENIPIQKRDKDGNAEKAFIDVRGCDGLILVSVDYFLENEGFLREWAIMAKESLAKGISREIEKS